MMPTPPLDPPVADCAPQAVALTKYDRQHLITYLRLLDAEHRGENWQTVARVVLHLDPGNDLKRARLAWETHLARAHWMIDNGYHGLMQEGPPL
jgi:hypothetical protein